MYHYYVYYRVGSATAAGLRQAVGALQQELARRTGTVGRLLRKRGPEDVWMEIYESVADPARFEQEMEDLVARMDLRRWLEAGSERHIECFKDFSE